MSWPYDSFRMPHMEWWTVQLGNRSMRRRRKKKMNKRGQLSIVNSIYWIILVVVSIVLTPLARGFINDAITQTNNTMEILTLNAILPIYWLMLISVIVFYGIPRGGGNVQY